MKGIRALPDHLKGKAVFIVGNGQSKRFYNISTLARYGLIFACNTAFKDHPVDVLGFRDDDTLKPCSRFPGIKCTWIQAPTRKDGAYIAHAEPVFGWEYIDDNRPSRAADEINPNAPSHPDWGKGDVVKRGSTGFILAQIALRLGAPVIILVGCDCGRLPGFTSTKTTENDAGQLRGPLHDRYEKFAFQFEALCARARAKGSKLFKLGVFGEVKVPILQPEDLLNLEVIRP